MSTKNHLMALIAMAIPKAQLFENIKDAIIECELFPDDQEKEDALSAHMQMLMLKRIIEQKGFEEIIKDWDKFEQREKLFEPNKN